MEQKVSIFSPVTQNGQPLKNQNSLTSLKPQADAAFTAFEDLVVNLTQTKPLGIIYNGIEEGPANPLSNLEQQLIELSDKTESFIATAVNEQSGPEAVEKILTHAVEQLWALVEEFDVQNGTNHVIELSKNILQATPKPTAGEGFSDLFTQPVSQPALEASTSPVETIAGGDKIQSHVFLQPTTTIREEALFAPVFNFLTRSEPAQQSLTLDTKTKPIQLSTPGAANTNFLAQNQFPPTKTVAQPVSDLQQKMPPFTVEGLQAKQTTANSITSQPALDLASRTSIIATTFIGGVDVKAKTNILLKEFAQTVVSNTSTPTIPQEDGGLVLQTKSNFLHTSPALQAELSRPTNNFSQNLANQIQGKTLNEGLTRIELAPRGLGNIMIDLQTQESGELKVVLRIESPVVLQALRTDREALLSVLSNGNISPEDITLDFEGFNQSQFDRKNAEIDQGQNAEKLDLDGEDIADTNDHSSLEQAALEEGRLDILT